MGPSGTAEHGWSHALLMASALNWLWMQVFVTAHQSVADISKLMLQELKRHNYVTPTNYLETVRGYRYWSKALQYCPKVKCAAALFAAQ